jgi:hypothetical protein
MSLGDHPVRKRPVDLPSTHTRDRFVQTLEETLKEAEGFNRAYPSVGSNQVVVALLGALNWAQDEIKTEALSPMTTTPPAREATDARAAINHYIRGLEPPLQVYARAYADYRLGAEGRAPSRSGILAGTVYAIQTAIETCLEDRRG